MDNGDKLRIAWLVFCLLAISSLNFFTISSNQNRIESLELLVVEQAVEQE